MYSYTIREQLYIYIQVTLFSLPNIRLLKAKRGDKMVKLKKLSSFYQGLFHYFLKQTDAIQ